MNIKKTNLQAFLLAAMLALPLAANANADAAALAAMPDDAPGAGPACGHPSAPGREEGHPMRGPEAMRGGPAMPGMMVPFGAPGMAGQPPFLRGLELSEAQQDKVFAILHAQEPYLRDQGKAAAKAHAGLRELAHGAQYDDAKAASLTQAGAQAMANIMLQHVRTEQKLLAVLTPEQRKQLADDHTRPQDQARQPARAPRQ
ncbi:Spy/CpxP family protein refolding chaperone [Rugamonas apoptosis]|uniref:Spy/CpxP family protein refolding chaperone n=1 Tax=Rugamonas apoptosis TaxID=2758570 RepID=A0A7W2FA14_9BURK|nr:Spy/CpxP family protein refolding chaperone [Rugamonas apoptosis]MBA5687822.1 Spy/CpxP family protein refolding chaperone [Rugamonas apoptosis]